MWPKQVLMPGMVEEIMAKLDRQELQGQEPSVVRDKIRASMKGLGLSLASLIVTMAMTKIVERWGLVLIKRPKRIQLKKPTQRLSSSSDDGVLTMRQQGALLSPLFSRLCRLALVSTSVSPLPMREFCEVVRASFLERGADTSPQALDELIRWLDDHAYILVSNDGGFVEVIGIPVAPPASTPAPHSNSE